MKTIYILQERYTNLILASFIAEDNFNISHMFPRGSKYVLTKHLPDEVKGLDDLEELAMEEINEWEKDHE